MSPQNEAKLLTQVADTEDAVLEIREELTETKKELQLLRVSIIGDKMLKPEVSGVLDIIKIHHTEMYGDTSLQHVGLKKKVDEQDKRIEALEDDRKRIYWMCGGISTGVWAVLYVVQWYYSK